MDNNNLDRITLDDLSRVLSVFPTNARLMVTTASPLYDAAVATVSELLKTIELWKGFSQAAEWTTQSFHISRLYDVNKQLAAICMTIQEVRETNVPVDLDKRSISSDCTPIIGVSDKDFASDTHAITVTKLDSIIQIGEEAFDLSIWQKNSEGICTHVELLDTRRLGTLMEIVDEVLPPLADRKAFVEQVRRAAHSNIEMRMAG